VFNVFFQLEIVEQKSFELFVKSIVNLDLTFESVNSQPFSFINHINHLDSLANQRVFLYIGAIEARGMVVR